MFKYSLSVILLLFSLILVAQRPGPLYNKMENDIYSEFEQGQLELLYNIYSEKIDPSYELINGRAYFPYHFRSRSKPILFDNSTHSSSITLKGIKYNNVCLELDIFTDEVIYIDSGRFCIYSPLMVAINKDHIDSFEFYYDTDTLLFRYFSKETDKTFNLMDGYYEVVSENNSKYIIKHSAIFKDLVGVDEYNYTQTGYADTGTGYSEIAKRKQFLRMFGDLSDQIRKYCEETEIKIPKADKQQIMSVLKYYDKLRNQKN